ncbi:MAG: SIR2 family protein [Candidatus Kapabacteria bacterium]|nr:SIR2 family protein [Candidatus Kapabacteria bacterium]
MTKKNISFFMGSGFSVPAGYPKMQEIDLAICYSTGAFIVEHDLNSKIRTKDYLFYFNIINKYLDFCSQRISIYKNKKIDLNYEIVYYEINRLFRIMKDGSDLLSDPILNELQTILSVHSKEFEKIDYFKHVLDSYCHNISKNVLLSLMSKSPTNLNKYDGFNSFIKRLSKFNIINSYCTTNYDLLIETLLSEQGLKYHENFRKLLKGDLPKLCKGRNMIKLYDSKMNFAQEAPKLLKLHGSIDNFLLSEDIGAPEFQKGHTIKSPNQYEFKQELGVNSTFKTSDAPEILIGTKNKLEEYHQFYYSRTFNKFLQCLDETHILIIIGYGFGDYGINQAFWNWLSNNEPAKMFIIDISNSLADFVKSKHNPKLFRHYNSIKRGKKLLYFKGGVENADYEQIFARINEIIRR